MKTIAIALLLGIELSTSAFASTTGCAQQVKSYTSKAANSYVYINRLVSPTEAASPGVPATAERL
ncbi:MULTISPECIES: hypothetical protein [Erwinia]|uniref:hypothetical protein n=1 Tax=Erwinia TaxID=551 RepID=UPI000554824D|nr:MULTISPECIES: hypothetical protein [Erwinia]